MNPRAVAAKVVAQVLSDGATLTVALGDHLKHGKNAGLIQELSYGVCRWYFRLDKLAKQYLQKPFKRSDYDIYALLLIGFYQLIYLRTPDHAAVYETVTAVDDFKKAWAKKVVNGVLRSFLRNRDQALSKVDADPVGQFAHPQWLIQTLKKNWPEQWQNILTANNQYPPMTLRVNLSKITRSDYLKLLAEKNISAQTGSLVSSAVVLTHAVPVTELPGFQDGLVSVQDEAAQLATELLALKSQQRILDACAAPGGKTAHILECEANLAELLAIDIDPKRVERIHENLQRLQLSTKVMVADVTKTDDWWDGQLFDRILLDAPCSATGVIRRHPDIKLLRREKDIPELAKTQLALLAASWLLLKPGGLLVYVTCSILPMENVAVMTEFLQTHSDAVEQPIEASWGLSQTVGRQILPGEEGMDGFYYTVVRKAELS